MVKVAYRLTSVFEVYWLLNQQLALSQFALHGMAVRMKL